MGEWVLQEGTQACHKHSPIHVLGNRDVCAQRRAMAAPRDLQPPGDCPGSEAISSTPTILTQVRKGLGAPSCYGPHSQRALCPLPTAGSDPGTPHLTHEQPSGAQDDKT